MASLMNQDEILLSTQCYEEVNFFVAENLGNALTMMIK